LSLIYNINIKTKPTCFIIINVGLTFKSNHEEFEKEYEELYKKRITHEFIRSELELSENVKIKLNGTFSRRLYLLDRSNRLYSISYKVQTALWKDPTTNKSNYVSIFPNFIKKYCPMSLHLLENISCNIRKGENVFNHIDDPECFFDCEDSILRPLKRFEKEFKTINPSALLNSKYTEVYNGTISINSHLIKDKLFCKVYELVLVARFFFGIEDGVLALSNKILLL
jgi:hypothetical protein